ncbi:phosphate-starvation-inducible protein PsiE, partial [Serratia sp. CY74664]
MAKTSRSIMIAKGLQRVLNVGLLLLAAILVVFLVKETLHLAKVLFIN